MKLQKTIAVFMSMLVAGQPVFADEVSAGATTTARYESLEVTHHKWKMFRCWGGAKEMRSAESVGSNSGQNTGENQSSGSFGTSGGGFGLTSQGTSTSWNAQYADQTFDVDFAYDVSAPKYDNHDGDCDSRETHTRVSSVSSDFFAKVKIHVPSDVWFVKIQLVSASPGVVPSAHLNGVGEAKLRSFFVNGSDENLVTNSVGFFSTRPGDVIELGVNWNPQGSNVSSNLKVKLKVTLVGQDDCQAITANVGGFTAQAIQGSLKSLAQGENDKLILGMGCFLRDDYGQKVLRSNDSPTVVALLNGISRIAYMPDSMIAKNNNLDVLRVVSTLVLYKLSYLALVDIKPLCSTTKIDDMYMIKDGISSDGFFYQYYFLTRILQRLGAYDGAPFHDFVQGLKYEAQKYGTYAELMKEPTRASNVNRAFQTLLSRIQVVEGANGADTLPFRFTLDFFNKLIKQNMDADAADMMYQSLRSLTGKQTQFSNELQKILYPLSHKQAVAIDTSKLESIVTEIDAGNRALLDYFSKKQRWFDASSTAETSPFVTDMTAYLVQIEALAAPDLYDHVLANHREEFLKRYNPAPLAKEVESCLGLKR